MVSFWCAPYEPKVLFILIFIKIVYTVFLISGLVAFFRFWARNIGLAISRLSICGWWKMAERELKRRESGDGGSVRCCIQTIAALVKWGQSFFSHPLRKLLWPHLTDHGVRALAFVCSYQKRSLLRSRKSNNSTLTLINWCDLQTKKIPLARKLYLRKRDWRRRCFAYASVSAG